MVNSKEEDKQMVIELMKIKPLEMIARLDKVISLHPALYLHLANLYTGFKLFSTKVVNVKKVQEVQLIFLYDYIDFVSSHTDCSPEVLAPYIEQIPEPNERLAKVKQVIEKNLSVTSEETFEQASSLLRRVGLPQFEVDTLQTSLQVKLVESFMKKKEYKKAVNYMVGLKGIDYILRLGHEWAEKAIKGDSMSEVLDVLDNVDMDELDELCNLSIDIQFAFAFSKFKSIVRVRTLDLITFPPRNLTPLW